MQELISATDAHRKLDDFLKSLSVDELRWLFKYSKNGAIDKMIEHHGKKKKEEDSNRD